ncbi:M16 family metallopeptidase [Treponema sp.]|uniref:M16 family metallopeptidase n=1 Tax=Treponema sp. TaxID=166 RepID=UPI00388EFC8C
MIKKQVLKNNVVLITQNDDSSKVATIGFYFSVGSRFEKDGEYGISHFTEHMLFKGTRTKSNKEISRIFDKMGGVTNAFTERENVSVYCSIPVEKKENFQIALDTICDLSENCIFPEEEFEKERGVVENEIYAVEDDPDDSSMDEIARRIWPDQDISRTITGSVEDVEAITREQMICWYEKYIVHGELVVIGTGKIDEGLLVQRLENLQQKKESLEFYRNAHFPDAVDWCNGNHVVKAKFNQEQIFALFPLDWTLSYKDYLSLMIFDTITGDSMSSRLFLELRERLGLCYSVGSFFTTYENAGLWAAYLVCEKKNALRASEALVKETCGLIEKEITQEEIDLALERISGLETMNDVNSVFLMRRLWNFYSLGFDLMTTDEFIKSIRMIKKDDIISFVRRLVDPSRRNVVVYGQKLSVFDRKKLLGGIQ